MNTDVLISVLSWEDRYIQGLEKNLVQFNPEKVLVFKYNNPKTAIWKEQNLKRTNDILGTRLELIEIDHLTPKENWFTFKEELKKYCENKKIVIDITTMPRESIWLILYNCKMLDCEVYYIYYQPHNLDYSNWVSRDPGRPRLLYKMSGIAKLGVPSLLLVTGGYDIQRLDSLIYNFEPKKTMLFFQNSNNLRNNDNFVRNSELFQTKYGIEDSYQYDAYNVESSFQFINEKLLQKENGERESYIESYNIILNSLGPKPSAITLFNFWLKYPQVALSYIPAREYNRDYCHGIGQSVTGKIPF